MKEERKSKYPEKTPDDELLLILFLFLSASPFSFSFSLLLSS